MVAPSKSRDPRVIKAEKELRDYWDRSFEHDDTIERIRKGEESVHSQRKSLPYFAELIGVDKSSVGASMKWRYQLLNPLIQAYVNIGRSHDHYIYPLHVDLAGAARSNIISRLHASLRFEISTAQWEVQVFGRNGVEFPIYGWVMPNETEDDQWRPLKPHAGYRFVIGEVEFEIRRNPFYISDQAMADAVASLAGVPEVESESKEGRADLVELVDAMESAEDGVSNELRADMSMIDLARYPVPRVPLVGSNGMQDPNKPVIEDDLDELDIFSLLKLVPSGIV